MGKLIILLCSAAVIVWAIRQYNATKKRNIPAVSFYVNNDDDILENDDWSVHEQTANYCPRPISARIKIRYIDSSGDHSERIVDVRECDTSAPDGYLNGFCHMRGSIRTFRIDRIESAIDLDSGELIQSLTEYAAKKYEESPVFAVDQLFENHSDALRVLFYIAKADGRFTAKEKDIYLEYCRSVYPDGRLDVNAIDNVLKWVDVPTMHTYKVICGKLAKLDESHKGVILHAAEAMIATQKTVTDEEKLAIEYMKKRFVAGK